MEHTSKWLVVGATTSSLFNADGGIEFVQGEIISPFGYSEYIMRVKDLKLDCMTVKDFLEEYRNIRSERE